MEKYTPQEIEEQLRYLQNAHNVTQDERVCVLMLLNEGTRDEGVFKWVKCPVWRLRLYQLAKNGIIREDVLDAISRYLLEGDKGAVAQMPSLR